MPAATTCLNPRTAARTELHQRIARRHRAWLAPTLSGEPPAVAAEDAAAAAEFIRGECAAVAAEAALAPSDPDGFAAWFRALADDGPGQGDPLFPWLAEEAGCQDMLWFLRQELAGEAGFDDLVALAMVRMPARAKLEMGRNLWDELGRGNPAGAHAELLAATARALDLRQPIEETVWEALALANLMAGLVVERRAYQAVGALGVIELTAPGRVAQVAAGLRRLGIPASARRYYELHATLDVEHFRRWEGEVLRPLVAAEPRTARLLAQGALMRLRAGERCFERYRAELWPG